jgi:serine/threonine-protein kinase RsbW
MTTAAQASVRYALDVPGDTRSLSLIRNMAGHLALLAGFNDLDASKIEVAVDEACSNILEHGYRDKDPKPSIRLEFHLMPDAFVVEIFDCGAGFDFEAHASPSFPDHWNAGNVRGVGLYLIKECMDEVSYDRLGDCDPTPGNRLRLLKRR